MKVQTPATALESSLELFASFMELLSQISVAEKF